ncbi:hypothetical protein WMF11_46380 [Sorangium sp. So ce295]|uniref:hypothetical protein n=1 Tax=Sorangium sp. So ce295 TaxID=3133295 RepID=UPI003F628CB6
MNRNRLMHGWHISGHVLVGAGAFFAMSCKGAETQRPAASTSAAVQAPRPERKDSCETQPSYINVAACAPPTDVAAGADLNQAATFAWQEFISLNWPAVKQTFTSGTRGQLDANARLDAINDKNGTTPTWMTYRHKIEVFPGGGNKDGVKPYNYDDKPQYIYDSTKVGGDGTIPLCDGGDPQNLKDTEGALFLNADEATQIGQNSMFAGVVEAAKVDPNDPAASQIVFMVKANPIYVKYVQQTGWFTGIPSDIETKTKQYVQDNKKDPEAGSTDLVSLPLNTILTKSAWRRAVPGDEQTHLVRPLRRYKLNGSNYCYAVNYYTLVALHIIQKTNSAPQFIYASFEAADNILTQDGQRVEDDSGRITSQGQPARYPAITSVPATGWNKASRQKITAASDVCTPGSSLYYENNPKNKNIPQAKVCVRARLSPIPQTIIRANDAAHQALDSYAEQNGSPKSVLRYYKLVNVQHVPATKEAMAEYTGGGGVEPATYYMANMVLETSQVLQHFSGGFAGNPDPNSSNDPADGTITDYAYGGDTPQVGPNLSVNGTNYLMGGCMGCHGQAQKEGGGFSFALDGIAKGFSAKPEYPRGPGNQNGFDDFAARWQRRR